MSTEHDRFEPTQADLRASNDQSFARPLDADRAEDLDRSRQADRPMTDREVVYPRAEGQPADRQSADASANDRAALFEPTLLNDFNARWTDVQTSFVDEPRRAVHQADALVSDVIQRISDTFGNERAQLEQQWDRGGDVSTEELRQALQRYRAFFSRLLTL